MVFHRKGDDLVEVGFARAIPRHDTTTPWYKPLSPRYDAVVGVHESDDIFEMARTGLHELKHQEDILQIQA